MIMKSNMAIRFIILFREGLVFDETFDQVAGKEYLLEDVIETAEGNLDEKGGVYS